MLKCVILAWLHVRRYGGFPPVEIAFLRGRPPWFFAYYNEMIYEHAKLKIYSRVFVHATAQRCKNTSK